MKDTPLDETTLSAAGTPLALPVGQKLSWLEVSLRVDGQWRRVVQAPAQPVSADADFDYAWRNGDTIRLTFHRRDRAAFGADRIRVEIAFPLLNFGRVLVPDCGRHYVNCTKALDIRAPLYAVTPANAGHPFMAVQNEAGRFAFGFGIISATGEVAIRRRLPLISQRKALVGGDDHLALEIEWAGPAGDVRDLEVDLFMTESRPSWFHALRRFTQIIKQREEITYPANPDAWRPGWCTWTAFSSDDLSEERVLDNARIARDLGIGTVILDDGWFGPGLDSEREPLNIGDYEPDPTKFADLRGTVDKLHALGLKALLWHAPLCVAQTSRTYGEMSSYLMYQDGAEFTSVNGLAMLCPACPEVREYVAAETERLLRDYGADGLKVDLYNCLPPAACDSPHHTHDVADGVAALEKVMQAQWERALAVKPSVLIELKQDYGNVRLLRYGTMVRAGDTAYDVDTNCWRCFYDQAYAACVHNDYLMTSTLTDPEALGLLMVRMLAAGVPTFGNDLTRLSDEHRRLITAWLRFYNTERELFERSRAPQDDSLDAWQGGLRERAWVAALWQRAEIRLPDAATVFILNGTGRRELFLRTSETRGARLTLLDHRLEQVSECVEMIEDGFILPVLPGGMTILTRR